MPNPSGANQLGDTNIPYGQVKQVDALKASAPMAGSPEAASDIAAPERAHDRATRPSRQGGVAAGAPGPLVPAPAPVLPPLPDAQAFALELRDDPGVSDELRELIAEYVGGA